MIRIFVDASEKDGHIGIGMVVEGVSDEGLMVVTKIIKMDETPTIQIAEQEGIMMAINYYHSTLHKFQQPAIVLCDNLHAVDAVNRVYQRDFLKIEHLKSGNEETRPYLQMAHNASRLYMPLLEQRKQIPTKSIAPPYPFSAAVKERWVAVCTSNGWEIVADGILQAVNRNLSKAFKQACIRATERLSEPTSILLSGHIKKLVSKNALKASYANMFFI
ncbi:hypothetical protein D3C78_19770 [compost metagenome]